MSSYQLYINGTAVGSDVYGAIASLEVEENADRPDALRLKLPLQPTGTDITWVSDARIAMSAVSRSRRLRRTNIPIVCGVNGA